jgi:hypothetical protein
MKMDLTESPNWRMTHKGHEDFYIFVLLCLRLVFAAFEQHSRKEMID